MYTLDTRSEKGGEKETETEGVGERAGREREKLPNKLRIDSGLRIQCKPVKLDLETSSVGHEPVWFVIKRESWGRSCQHTTLNCIYFGPCLLHHLRLTGQDAKS